MKCYRRGRTSILVESWMSAEGRVTDEAVTITLRESDRAI